MDFNFIKLPKGIELRKPTKSELDFFKKSGVPGYAADDNKVVLNPNAGLSKKALQALALNESTRIYLRKNPNVIPNFELTSLQKAMLDTTAYRNASETDRKATVAARVLVNDSSVGIPTEEQRMFASQLSKAMKLDSLNIDWNSLDD